MEETGSKSLSIVLYNESDEAFEIFRKELIPYIIDVRGEKVKLDAGDYVHFMEHEYMLSRIRWIPETLRNPEEIRRDFHKYLPFREIYVNTVYCHEKDCPGSSHLIVVDRRQELKLWTSFIVRGDYLKRVKEGELLWKPENS